MRQVNASFRFAYDFSGEELLKRIEQAGRICYKSECKISETSHLDFVRRIISNGHESVLEHAAVSVIVTCDRGVSHEIVRHRIASYSQESTRYCNYSQERFGGEVTFITPYYLKDYSTEVSDIWTETMNYIEKQYFILLNLGLSPQEARAVLPNSLKTEIFMTMNIREWRHFFRLRTSSKAHSQMQEISRMMLLSFREKIPVVFDDIIFE